MSHAEAVHGAVAQEDWRVEHNRAKFGMWLFLASEIMFFSGYIGAYIVLRSSNAELTHLSQAMLNKWLAAGNTLVLIISSLTMALAVHAASKGERGKLAGLLLVTALLGTTFLVVKGIEYNAKFTHSGIKAERREGRIFVTEAEDFMRARGVRPGDEILEFNGVEAGKLGDLQGIEHPHLGDTIKIRTQTDGEVHQMKLGVGPWTNVFYSAYFCMTGFHGLHVLGGVVVLLLTALWAAAGKFPPTRFMFVENVGLYWHFVDIVWIFLFPIVYLI